VINPDNITRIIDKYRDSRGALIAILEDIQADFNYLPEEALRLVAEQTGNSLVDIYGVATFYTSFSLEPRGRHLVSVCTGTACHVRGSARVLEKFQDTLEVKPGQTTGDKEFTLSTVNCLGACALGPVAVLDGVVHRNLAPHKVQGVVHECRCTNGDHNVLQDRRCFRVNISCPQCNRSLMTWDHLLDGAPMIHITVSFLRKHGWLRLSSFYGDYRIQSEHEIPEDTIVDFFCPRCHARLRTTRACAKCDAPMVPLFVRGGGIVRLCSRRGCKEHQLDLVS
jgi:NADH-quinone oxidoreductase subunit E